MAPGAKGVELRAGTTRAVLDGIDLRDVGVPVPPLLDRVYVAVRAADWSTVPGDVSDLELRTGRADFHVAFDVRHIAGDLDFRWHGEIDGDLGGRVTCSMEGHARTSFDYCRIGFCVLHPDRLAGARYEAETADGAAGGELPLLVAPQLLREGTVVPPIPAFRALSVTDAEANVVRIGSDGEPFEMEDQRNWTDASFKSYIPPLRPGYPFRAQRGQRFRQRIIIDASAAPGRRRPRPRAEPVRLDISRGPRRSLPAIGLGLPPVVPDPEPDTETTERLRRLRTDHLRVGAWLTTGEGQAGLDTAARSAVRLGCPLEVALFVSAEDERPVRDAVERLEGVDVTRWAVFDAASADRASTSAEAASLLRRVLDESRPGATLAAGSATDFTRLNRGRTVDDGVDALAWSIIPTAHATDDRSVMDNTTAQGITVETARSFAGGRSLCVGPVVLSRRPAEADPRQATLFAAAWTVGSLADLARAGPDSLTYFETVGSRGLIDDGRPFPLYHVFEHVQAMRSGELLHVSPSAPRRSAGLAVRHGDEITGMAANLEPSGLQVWLGPVGEPVRAWLLGDAGDPAYVEIPVDGTDATISLAPYGVVLFAAAAPAGGGGDGPVSRAGPCPG